MVSLASLLCGAALYPVVVHLSTDNERKTREVLESQSALIEGLQRSERELEGKVSQRTVELQREQHRTKELLHNILPIEIAEELSATGSARPARHDSVTILFTDFIGFTQAVSTMPADRMVAELNEIFAAFDGITDECGVEKIKTIGDAYMAAAGLPKACPDHAQRCVRAGLRMIEYLENRNRTAAFKWSLRVGVHSGPVVAGVVGKRKYAFDIWGDTVNVASRMESSGEIGRVNISAYTYDLIQAEFDCEYRGKVDARGKGQIDMYFVKGARPV
jgi:class 3 adenylate cyclase